MPTPLPLVLAFTDDDAGAELAHTLSVATLLALDPTKSNKKTKQNQYQAEHKHIPGGHFQFTGQQHKHIRWMMDH